MMRMLHRLTVPVVLAVLALVAPVSLAAREPAPGVATASGDQPPLPQPAADSGPLLRFMELRFHPDNVSLIEPQTYLYYIQTQPSRSLDGVWVPFNEQTEESLLADFKRLWGTTFLDNLWIEIEDAPYDNGVMGKRVIFHMEERSRIKIVDYTGSTKVERTKIDEKMRELGISLRLDSFLDEGAVRRVRGLVQSMMAEKGYQDAEITTSIEPLPGGPKLVKVVFHVEEGPKVRIRTVEFTGNEAMSDRALRRRMKDTKAHWFLSWMTGRGTYQEAKFDEDADLLVEQYRNRGYIEANVGQPVIERIGDSPDGKTRWVRLEVPITEGPRYRVGEFGFAGNQTVQDEFLRPLFKLKTGDWYSEKRIRDGLEKARELYGQGGYFEFTAYPDLTPEPAAAGPMAGPAEPTVNVTMQVQEGGQYFVNRITFTGNTTTRDTVVRRELRLVEGGVFNTEALKFSIRRLNQLGYFQQLEGGQDVQVDKTPDVANNVDVTMKLQEQNRNQLTFGAGVSQFEGFFGQLSFQTANFMGRGESLTVSLQGGSRAQNYQIAFTEPFLFDRNITGGVDVFKRELRYIQQFTQSSTGGNFLMGFPVRDFSRLFVTYSYEQVSVKDLNPAFQSPELLQRNPFLRDSLLIGEGGKRTISKIVPSFVFNTVDNPIFPNTGRRLQLSFDYAGPGGNTFFIKPTVEAVGYFRMTNRTTFGARAQFQYIRPYGSTERLPIFEQLFLGGEYSIRGFDLRSVGPRDPDSGLVLGGNKSLLFNAEYLISIAGPVRLVLFADAGQVRDLGDSFGWKEDIFEFVSPGAPLLVDPFANVTLTDPNAPPPERVVRGTRQAFKTSTGAEIRFFMPVLNVPFRLIFAMNPSRDGVLDNNFRPSKNFTFRFAVGSTF